MSQLKNFLKNFVSYKVWNFFISEYQYYKFLLFRRYSARGDVDKKLIEIINKKKGFYLEVGAFNGIAESISLRFEKELNWTGLLIEPNPLHYNYLKSNRSKNICLNNICLSKKYLNKKLFIKNLNLMSYIVNNKNEIQFTDYPIKRINKMAKDAKLGNFKNYECKIEILENIFKKKKIKVIDLAIIDVEGSELELLDGINFKKFDIKYFCIESYNFKKLKQYMKRKKYIFIKKLHREDYVFKKIS